jgi:hypothetical protein
LTVTTSTAPLLGRSCGSCTLCCKVFPVPPIDNKPAGKWCKHCKPGQGCGIWESRPEFCRSFHCHWHFDASLGPEWRPDVARFVINTEPGGAWLSVVVDPGQPHAWRREPYHSKLRSLAARFIDSGTNGLLLIEGDRKSIILPDREVHVGTRDTHAHVRLTRQVVDGAVRYDVVFDEPASAA